MQYKIMQYNRFNLSLAAMIVTASAVFSGGAKAESPQNRQLTRLNQAARSGNQKEVRTLLAQGQKPGAKDRAGWTPLHWLAAVGPTASKSDLRRSGTKNFAVARQLLRAGAPVDAALPTGQTPLFIAAVSGRADLVKLFLARGAKPDPKDDLGCTPLHKAARNGNTQVIRLLLARGAKAGARDNAGWTPLHWLAAVGPTATKAELRRSGTQNLAAARELLRAGAPVDAALSTGQTPLFVAAASGRADLVKLFLARGAKPNPVDNRKRRPLDVATSPAVRALLVRGKG